MAEPAAFKYRAFISYSHADTSWAKWLHRGLESFRIDKDLVGRETATVAWYDAEIAKLEQAEAAQSGTEQPAQAAR